MTGEVLQKVLDLLGQGHPGLDATAALIGVVLLMSGGRKSGEQRSLLTLVLAIGLVLVFGGHLMIHITMPGGPS